MFFAKKSQEVTHYGRGLWDLVKPYSREFVYFRCPNGHLRVLETPEYKVGNNGTVYPEVKCDREGCSFNEFVTLQDWDVLQKYGKT
jgi:hypothetical protein